jgi:Spy/CpxP family protein refolding chaperone
VISGAMRVSARTASAPAFTLMGARRRVASRWKSAMKRIRPGKALSAAVLIGGTIVAAGALADQTRHSNDLGSGMIAGTMSGYGSGNGTHAGMMSGYRNGMGPGSQGGDATGHGMKRGYGLDPGLNLSLEQRDGIFAIHDALQRKHWALAGRIREEQARMDDQYASHASHDAALSASYRKILALRQQMFDLSLGARTQIDAVLTPEQRARLKRG